jgi:hypothetical protein
MSKKCGGSRLLAGVVAVWGLLAGVARAQEGVYQTESRIKLIADALLRQEWTRDLFADAPDQNRKRFQMRPRLEAHLGSFVLGVGGDFNYSSDENQTPPRGSTTLALTRDNYDSRDARLDMAFARWDIARWLRLEGGRFEMPVALTEMIWDRDLRPQGAAVSLRATDRTGAPRFVLTALGARGSHVFDDDDTDMLLASAGLHLTSGLTSRLELLASFVVWDKIETMETKIRRQNSRLNGAFINDYRVLDVLARLSYDGPVPTQFVADYCRNTAVDTDNRGIWLAVALGSLKTSRSRLEYTYANVDKDATLAAYGTDDFFWATGWEGHRADLGFRASDTSSLHTIAETMRFKDSPNVAERDHFIKRFRVEVRFRR